MKMTPKAKDLLSIPTEVGAATPTEIGAATLDLVLSGFHVTTASPSPRIRGGGEGACCGGGFRWFFPFATTLPPL